MCLSLSLCCSINRKSKTKPNGKKPPTEEKKQYLEAECTKVRVVDFDLKELVVLPREIDLNEWLASNSMYLYVWIIDISQQSLQTHTPLEMFLFFFPQRFVMGRLN